MQMPTGSFEAKPAAGAWHGRSEMACIASSLLSPALVCQRMLLRSVLRLMGDVGSLG